MRGASADALARIPIDEVVALLDEAPPRYRELYYRWEAEQWEAALVDLEGDRREWSLRPGPEAVVRRLADVRAVIEGLRQSAAVLADSMPGEEQQVFLTTQMADEARRAVLLDRFFSEVIGAQVPATAGPGPSPLLQLLADSCSDVELLRRDRRALTAAVLVSHLVVEGGFLVSNLRFLVHALVRDDSLHGLRAGLGAATRDSTRHIGFALRFLREACSRSERTKAVARARLEEAVPALRSTLMLEDADDEAMAGPEEVTRYALSSLAARLDVVGLEMP